MNYINGIEKEKINFLSNNFIGEMISAKFNTGNFEKKFIKSMNQYNNLIIYIFYKKV